MNKIKFFSLLIFCSGLVNTFAMTTAVCSTDVKQERYKCCKVTDDEGLSFLGWLKGTCEETKWFHSRTWGFSSINNIYFNSRDTCTAETQLWLDGPEGNTKTTLTDECKKIADGKPENVSFRDLVSRVCVYYNSSAMSYNFLAWGYYKVDVDDNDFEIPVYTNRGQILGYTGLYDPNMQTLSSTEAPKGHRTLFKHLSLQTNSEVNAIYLPFDTTYKISVNKSDWDTRYPSRVRPNAFIVSVLGKDGKYVEITKSAKCNDYTYFTDYNQEGGNLDEMFIKFWPNIIAEEWYTEFK